MKQTVRLCLLVTAFLFFASLLYHPISPLASLASTSAADRDAARAYFYSISPWHKEQPPTSPTAAGPEAPATTEAEAHRQETDDKLDVAVPKHEAAVREGKSTKVDADAAAATGKSSATKKVAASGKDGDPDGADQVTSKSKSKSSASKTKAEEEKPLAEALAEGEPIAPPLFNATLKAELGRAAWKLFHTTLARLPLSITSKEQRSDLEHYLRSFAVYYPCGDCSRHFQALLKKYPPQTSGRVAASLWGCRMHNQVNERLEKPEYDCATILEDYDCGCGDDEKKAKEGEEPADSTTTTTTSTKTKEKDD